MTIAEMHVYADERIDKANSEWFTPVEKDSFINQAIMEYTKNKHKAFETGEKVREDLLTLVSDTIPFANTDIIDLTAIADFLFVLRIEADIETGCGLKTGLPVPPVQHDDFAETQRDPFNKAEDLYPQYLQNVQGGNKTIQVYSDNTPEELRMVYLKRPAVVNITTPVNCDLPEHTHEEIVNIAIRMMLATIEGFDGYQVQLNEINNQE